MNSFVNREIEIFKDSYQLPDPLLKVEFRGNTIRMAPEMHKPAKNQWLHDTISDGITVEWNKARKEYELRERWSLRQGVRQYVLSLTKQYIERFSDSKNPKLTSLYRWFARELSTNHMEEHTELENLMYEAVKYVDTLDSTNRDHRSNATAIFEVIRTKFKQKGVGK